MDVGGEQGPIAAVREGMSVVDAAGQDVGKVEEVRFGNPEAASDQGQDRDSGGLMEGIANVFTDTDPDVHPQLAARLARVGFVRIDPGLGRKDTFAAADDIERVDGDTVHLRVPESQLGGDA